MKWSLVLGLASIGLSAHALENESRLVVQLGHSAQVTAAAFSPDGRQLLTGSADATARIWDVATGLELRTFRGHIGAVQAVTYSPDGRLVATGGTDGAVRLWDPRTGKESACLVVATGVAQVTKVSFSPTGQRLLLRLSQYNPSTEWSEIWDVQSARKTASTRFENPKFDSDGKRLLVRSDNEKRLEWLDASTGKRTAFKDSHPYFHRLDLATNGLTAVTLDDHGGLVVWDTVALRKQRTIQVWNTYAYGWSVQISPDGTLALAIMHPPDHGFTVTIWNLKTGVQCGSFDDWEDAMFSPNTKLIGGTSGMHTAFLSETSGGEILPFQLVPPKKPRTSSGGWFSGLENLGDMNFDFNLNKRDTRSDVKLAAFSPDSQRIAIIHENMIKVLDVSSGVRLDGFKGIAPISIRDARLESGRGQLMVALEHAGHGQVVGVDLKAGALDSRIDMEEEIPGVLEKVRFSPQGKHLYDRNHIWETATGKITGPGVSGFSGSEALVFHEEQKGVSLYDSGSDQPLFTFTQVNPTNNVSAKAVSWDGKSVLLAEAKPPLGIFEAIGRAFGNIKISAIGMLVDTFSRQSKPGPEKPRKQKKRPVEEQPILRLWRHVDLGWTPAWTQRFDDCYAIKLMQFDRAGDRLLIGDDQGKLRLLRSTDARPVMALTNHTEPCLDAVFSGDEKRLLTGSGDYTARLWDVASQKEIAVLRGHQGDVFRVMFDEDESRAITASADGTVRFWELKSGRLLCSLVFLAEGGWVVFDPQGRFDTDDIEGIHGLHWIMPDDPFTPLPLETFMRDYYEPRLLPRILAGEKLKPVRALMDLNRVQPKVTITKIELQTNDPALVTEAIEVSGNQREFQRGGTNILMKAGAHDVRLFRDGQLVSYSPTNATGGEIKLDPKTGKALLTFENIHLPRNLDTNVVEFSAYAFNEDRVKSATARQNYTLAKPLAPSPRRAYIISFGVNAYEDPAWDLKYAVNDARLVQQVISNKLAAAGLQSEIICVPLLADAQSGAGQRQLTVSSATKKNLQTVLARLAGQSVPAEALREIPNADKLQPARPEDFLLLSFSCHGDGDRKGNFYFLPHDIGTNAAGRPISALYPRCISSEELSFWLRDVDAGEMVMIVDACHSAAAVEGEGFKPGPMGSRGLGQLAYDKGMRILVASQADNVALESDQLQQGLLTYALIRDGLESQQADFKPADRNITLSEWLGYGVQRLPKLYAEMKAGRINTYGRKSGVRSMEPENEASPGKATPFQQPALFDFAKKRRDPVIEKISNTTPLKKP